jgi:predicted nucleic acid-binding protein
VTLVDTGPLVALFDPQDPDHDLCRKALAKLSGPLLTTVAVLTEAFHLLEPDSLGADNLRRFLVQGGLLPWFFDDAGLDRALTLMDEYRKQPMDLADASIVAAAERLKVRRIFTLDRRDFRVYRPRFGHKRERFKVVP